MMRRIWPYFLTLLVTPISVFAEDRTSVPEHLAFFESKIRPVLVAHCYECHSSESKIV